MEDLKIGQRCALTYCNQKDFLPYQCRLCNLTLCHDHVSAHYCENTGADDNYGMHCPDCHVRITYTAADDPQHVLELHRKEPACVKKPAKKTEKCSSCYLKLTTLNKYSCAHCGKLTCLKHRVRDSHSCAPLSAMISWRDMVTAY